MLKVLLLLLLLLSRFSRVRLSVTPQRAARQAPLSLGFSRQEHWSGLPCPAPMHKSEKWKWSGSVVPRLLVTPWTAAYQAPPSMGFSRQEFWSGLPLPSPLKVLKDIIWIRKNQTDVCLLYELNKININAFILPLRLKHIYDSIVFFLSPTQSPLLRCQKIPITKSEISTLSSKKCSQLVFKSVNQTLTEWSNSLCDQQASLHNGEHSDFEN